MHWKSLYQAKFWYIILTVSVAVRLKITEPLVFFDRSKFHPTQKKFCQCDCKTIENWK